MSEIPAASRPPLPPEDYDSIDLRELWGRLIGGLPKTLGYGALGLAIAAAAYFAAGPFLTVSSTTRVVFSFTGYERGEYPDGSRFQADDLRAPEIVSEALKRQGLETSENFQSRVRAALTIEGIIPANVIKERDRLRAAGQTPPTYRPDEYQVSLSLPRKFPLGNRQRELLLNEVVSVFRERFQRTYSEVPVAFGNAFESLRDADLFDYELVLNQEIQNILSYLQQQQENAKTFRSPTTNMSFNDLLKQTQIFSQIRLNETLGLIRLKGLSRDRRAALIKIDYYLRALQDQEQRAMEDESVVLKLLEQAATRNQGYVLGVKAQATLPRADALVVDQNLIDSLLAHDSYNFLMREALKAGREVKRLQAEKAIVEERRGIIERLVGASDGDLLEQQIAEVKAALEGIERDYQRLLQNIRRTHAEFAAQEYGDAIRISMQAMSDNFYTGLAKAGLAGLAVGLAAGIGLSLLGVGLGRREAPGER